MLLQQNKVVNKTNSILSLVTRPEKLYKLVKNPCLNNLLKHNSPLSYSIAVFKLCL